LGAEPSQHLRRVRQRLHLFGRQHAHAFQRLAVALHGRVCDVPESHRRQNTGRPCQHPYRRGAVTVAPPRSICEKRAMTRTRLVAVWMRSRSALRARWRSWLGLAVIVGAAGGFVIAAAAGARRTSSVYTRLLAVTAPFDVALGCAELEQGTECREDQRQHHRAALALPEVAAGAVLTPPPVPITPAGGRSLQPAGEICFGGPGGAGGVGAAPRGVARGYQPFC